ncbi:MAG: hypothetical protein ABS42_00475 [Bdellovibrio sp. SCN 50-8]|nr:MAG: hypothetical protein ABS42_00475 [Bdellovibrio sp. SCN 50-8]
MPNFHFGELNIYFLDQTSGERFVIDQIVIPRSVKGNHKVTELEFLKLKWRMTCETLINVPMLESILATEGFSMQLLKVPVVIHFILDNSRFSLRNHRTAIATFIQISR